MKKYKILAVLVVILMLCISINAIVYSENELQNQQNNDTVAQCSMIREITVSDDELKNLNLSSETAEEYAIKLANNEISAIKNELLDEFLSSSDVDMSTYVDDTNLLVGNVVVLGMDDNNHITVDVVVTVDRGTDYEISGDFLYIYIDENTIYNIVKTFINGKVSNWAVGDTINLLLCAIPFVGWAFAVSQLLIDLYWNMIFPLISNCDSVDLLDAYTYSVLCALGWTNGVVAVIQVFQTHVIDIVVDLGWFGRYVIKGTLQTPITPMICSIHGQ